ncbi:adenylate/guanylate cyclase domain-containing protein [Roseomonas mucosa]|uniref:adenylate/guanylate cyclase domain-containing protein n=1 Tax=Roseomonas mucosa TaxID=207340 RepID=UPI00123B7DE4|nr:adenylate/guanylate cyclase domain-containing protein [Roseomonas mucosa]QET91487.1 cyclic nucleotide-binding domain-containing protein [Roseomonas mucosa]
MIMDGGRVAADPGQERFSRALKQSGLFAGMDEEGRAVVIAKLRPRRKSLVQGEVLCQEGEGATSFWLLTRGEVQVAGKTPAREVFVERRGAGDLIGELAAMRPGTTRSATVTALDHTVEAYCFSMRGVEALPLQEQLEIWRGLAIHVAGKLASTVPSRIGAHLQGEERAALLRRFVNEDVLGSIEGPDHSTYEFREAVIWFSDLVGFSAMAAKAKPQEVAATIRAAMSAQSDAIAAAGGLVDKMTGDGLMAYWLPESDAPEEQRRVANAAFDAAVAAARAVEGVVSPVTGRPMRVRIGLHVGEAHYGNFGSGERWAFTLIGQPVNIAARIESAKPDGEGAPAYGPLRVSADLATLLDENRSGLLPHSVTTQVKTDLVTFFHRQPE